MLSTEVVVELEVLVSLVLKELWVSVSSLALLPKEVEEVLALVGSRISGGVPR